MKKNSIKNFILPFSICLLLALAMYPNSILNPEHYSTKGLALDYNVSANLAKGSLEAIASANKNNYSPNLGKSFHGFKEALAFKESQGNYFVVNTLGYLGKYQFGRTTLELLGIYDTELFLKSPELQEKAFIANAKRNKWVLRNYIKRYNGKTINGLKITESGILAAAHLAGPGSVKTFLRSSGSNNFSDAYGATVAYYMKKFSGYDTSIIKANKKAKVKL